MNDWRETLTEAFDAALDQFEQDAETDPQLLADLDAEMAPNTEVEGDLQVPDLYSFYEALAVLRNEHRAGNRKSAEVLSQLSETLQLFDRRLADLRSDQAREQDQVSSLPRGHLLALLDLADRAGRLEAALAEPPASPLFGAGKWLTAWENVASATSIFTTHVSALIEKAGITRISTVGQSFDPERMTAVATVSATTTCPAGSVARESSPGYLFGGEVLRLAEVEIVD